MGSLEDIEVLRIGTPCLVSDDIKAVISAISISYNNHVTYQVVWWNSRERKNEWMHRNEFQLIDTEEKVVVGFHRISTKDPT